MLPPTLIFFSSCREKEKVPSVLDLIHYSKKARDTLDRVKEFLKEHVYPVEMVRKYLYLIANNLIHVL